MAMPDHPTDVLELLSAFVRFPSLSKQEGPIADFVEAYARAEGLHVGRLDDNVYFWIGDGPDLLLLNSHLDVVPPSSDHPYDPFIPTLVDGKLYGRGTVDAKASGAAMTMALVELAEAGWTPPGGKLMVALTTCEEIGGDYNGLQHLRPHLPPIHAALVGEPTEMTPVVSQKGLLILKIHAEGRTAHAARAHLGENAIYKAAADIARLQQLAFDREDPYLGKPTVTVTMIQGGTARNVVPDHCVFDVDIRSTPAYTHDELVAYIQAQVASRVEVHSKRLIPVATPVDARIVRACRQALPDREPIGSPTASDWIFLPDVPTVKIGPGPSSRSHTPDEHIEIDAVFPAVDVYKQIVKHYFD
ncbi:MAG: M20/M25/M40 family metallo-hydrolase [Rhodothermales bacterium]|nr:M20/M25/M40 family metallo-hydrolase [Rhodothermales bacterium]